MIMDDRGDGEGYWPGYGDATAPVDAPPIACLLAQPWRATGGATAGPSAQPVDCGSLAGFDP